MGSGHTDKERLLLLLNLFRQESSVTDGGHVGAGRDLSALIKVASSGPQWSFGKSFQPCLCFTDWAYATLWGCRQLALCSKGDSSKVGAPGPSGPNCTQIQLPEKSGCLLNASNYTKYWERNRKVRNLGVDSVAGSREAGIPCSRKQGSRDTV